MDAGGLFFFNFKYGVYGGTCILCLVSGHFFLFKCPFRICII